MTFAWQAQYYQKKDKPALASDDHITLVNFKAGWAVNGKSLMTLFISLIFWTEVEVVTTNDNSTIHGSALNNTTKNMATDANITSEGAFLINIAPNDGFTWGLEAKTNGVIITNRSVFLGLSDITKLVYSNSVLLLEWSFTLYKI